ncbi:uncharacterized protein LOC130126763 [Lampris incognitus]|uniref:uncharacterized protein LOC130126763 n=1 Tax=Lampris incognitus TaxID=2546036 RepID=UPI0024B53724|nr:uncharacterized protein LOC130126763 [Lampris incognitus]
MGSSTSRGKKIAPACVTEVNGCGRDANAGSPKRDTRSLKPLTTPKFTKDADADAPSRALSDCHSQGRDSDFSVEEEEEEDDDHGDVEGELDRVVSDCVEYDDRDTKRTPKTPKKSFIRSKTFGLCHLKRVHTDNGLNSTPRLQTSMKAEEACGVDVNRKNDDELGHSRKLTPPRPDNGQSGLLTRGPFMEPVPRSGKNSPFGNRHKPSFALPVILYDGSEEELMDTIEREFS